MPQRLKNEDQNTLIIIIIMVKGLCNKITSKRKSLNNKITCKLHPKFSCKHRSKFVWCEKLIRSLIFQCAIKDIQCPIARVYMDAARISSHHHSAIVCPLKGSSKRQWTNWDIKRNRWTQILRIVIGQVVLLSVYNREIILDLRDTDTCFERN